ncbi:transglycosylase [Sphingorhabdus lutea]|uniref:Transglycosylase n=1 Tax=Sphingorhabdus lutea TaxID=1913578 RepID=A0A1L3JDR5_9SPHN|nr:GlsB/YeaQ/YmgE family stress response membrane protein [Sphingorhabdus lutea]APG63275.1 transglycosylase [Sphingorhabdus lutea]
MGWILALIMGGIMGWLASKVMNRDASMGIIMNIVVGCIGSILGRFLLGGILGGGRLRDSAFDPMTLLTSFLGALILLAIVNFFQRGKIR